MIENNILGIILAGGKSSRFGEDKSTAKLGNKTLLDHTVSKIENEFNEILVISNNKEFNFKNNKIHIVEDYIEGQLGPLVGILTAMKWVLKNKKNYKWIASFPCDTPFFDIKLISDLKIKVKETSKKLIFLNSNKKRHNIFGLWSLDLIEILEEDIKYLTDLGESPSVSNESWEDIKKERKRKMKILHHYYDSDSLLNIVILK